MKINIQCTKKSQFSPVQWAKESRQILQDHLKESLDPESVLFQEVYGKVSALSYKHEQKVNGLDLKKCSDHFLKNYQEIRNATLTFIPEKNSIEICKRQGDPFMPIDPAVEGKRMLSNGNLAKRIKASNPSWYDFLSAVALKNKTIKSQEV